MNVLLLGSGGREHALAWKLRQSPSVDRLLALPGSDGMRNVAEPVAGDPNDCTMVAAAAERENIGLTVVGPEAPLAAGIVDYLAARGKLAFGPTRAAAQLEASKIFAKQFMARYRIPTARFATCSSLAEAESRLQEFTPPLVLKADGLAAGKGVVIAESRAQASAACRAMLNGELVGSAGARLVIEEYLRGEELSFLFLCDGTRAVALAPAQDHKRVFDGDRGPNTGGMGAYSLDSLVSPELRTRIEQTIVLPTLRGMQNEGSPFRGVLYCGLMLTESGPRVLEFNARFGDPETQPLMLRCEGDLAGALASAAEGHLDPALLRWSPQPAACVVAASGGYPGKYRTGLAIRGLENAPASRDTIIFHAGTRCENGKWVTAGGRVLGVTARAESLREAVDRCYEAMASITFEGMHYRHDIGARALARMEQPLSRA